VFFTVCMPGQQRIFASLFAFPTLLVCILPLCRLWCHMVWLFGQSASFTFSIPHFIFHILQFHILLTTVWIHPLFSSITRNWGGGGWWHWTVIYPGELSPPLPLSFLFHSLKGASTWNFHAKAQHKFYCTLNIKFARCYLPFEWVNFYLCFDRVITEICMVFFVSHYKCMATPLVCQPLSLSHSRSGGCVTAPVISRKLVVGRWSRCS